MSPVWSVKETQSQNQVSSAVSGMHYSCRPLSWRAWSCPERRRRRTLRVEENRWFPFSASLEVLQFRIANGSNPTSSFVHRKTLALAIIIAIVSKTFAVVIMFPLCRYHVRLTTATYCPGMHTTDHSGLWAEIVFDTWPSARGTEFWKCRVNGAFKICHWFSSVVVANCALKLSICKVPHWFRYAFVLFFLCVTTLNVDISHVAFLFAKQNKPLCNWDTKTQSATSLLCLQLIWTPFSCLLHLVTDVFRLALFCLQTSMALSAQAENKEEVICFYLVWQFFTQLSMSYLRRTSAEANWQLINVSGSNTNPTV